MATCERSLQHIFDNLLPENPTLLESLSLNKIKHVKSLESSSSTCTEIFGELHFKESSPPSQTTETNNTKLNENKDSESSDTSQTPSSASFSITEITSHANSRDKSSGSFSWLSSESMHLCTEGLGFESSDDVEDSKSGINEHWQIDQNEKHVEHRLSSRNHSYGECRRSRVSGYPPPISIMRRTGKPGVYFRSYRDNGRFVLEEVRIPTQEFLRAYREDGRLKLQFVHPPEDEFMEEEGEEEDDTGSIDDEREDIGKEDDDCVTQSFK
ncbi:protein FAF-like, chloroplastic [Vicia villosa]|uniref:protein FAF-like, chloroplastic n=1 Tax=Vicia villosa TaxID=3911 RepID=UPI00273BAAC5|nr:protein FAF-like, chloroplastic [Vicia villosa]